MNGNLDLARAQDGYKRGATLVINRLEKFWPPCTALAKQMEDALQIFTSLNMYFTPPGSRGFDPHFDYEDVFIVQVQGIKRWRVWEPDPAVGQEVLALNDERSRQSKAKSAVPTTAPRYRCPHSRHSSPLCREQSCATAHAVQRLLSFSADSRLSAGRSVGLMCWLNGLMSDVVAGQLYSIQATSSTSRVGGLMLPKPRAHRRPCT